MKNLPKKRGGAGALFLDKKGRILLLEPSYKNDWEIPGGIIEANESPKEACEREIYEELGIKKEVGDLLCLEYQREDDDSYMFVFDGGILSDKDIKNIKIQESEVKSFQFISVEDIGDKVLSKMFIRIKEALRALKEKETLYYETIYKK